MKTIIFLIGIFIFHFTNAQLSIQEIANLPVSVSNNAVCEGFINNQPFVFSFAGIDSTKNYAGLHLKAFRYDVQTNNVMTLPDLPDTLGKIACAASRVGDTIYISGGYHVFSNGNEVSSNRMHRFDISTNSYLSDGNNIPVATDDHVQAVWRDSLIYLITGWNNTGNIPNVQIYNPYFNSWMQGTALPNNNIYKSFGASGMIYGDTIYYFGGAKSSFGFGIQNQLRKGIINPNDPTDITWSFEVPDDNINGYRMAATTVGSTLHWIGGSNITYNYNGIAYNGSGGVPTSNRDLFISVESIHWSENFLTEIPMDLRGIANVSDSVKYIMGGMIANQEVTNKIYKLEWDLTFLTQNEGNSNSIQVQFYPNPVSDKLFVKSNNSLNLEICNTLGQVVFKGQFPKGTHSIYTGHLSEGIYYLRSESANGSSNQKLIKR